MARLRKYVESGFGSLVTRKEASSLEVGQLQVAENVSHRLIGGLGPSYVHSDIPSFADIAAHGFQALRLQGVDYILCADGVTMKAYNVTTAVTTTIETGGGPTGTHRFVGDGTRAYIVRGHNNRVYNPTFVDGTRPLGPTTFTETTGTLSTVADILVVSASAGSPTYLTLVASGDHGMQTGDLVYLSGFTGDWTGINGGYYTVTRYSATQISIVFDSTGFGSIGATAAYRKWPCVKTGNYKWRYSIQVTHASGDVIESEAIPIRVSNLVTGDPATTEFVAVDPTMVIEMSVAGLSVVIELIDYYGAMTDITVKGRLWRTKTNGVDFYLVGERTIAAGSGSLTVHDSVDDGDLGAIWLDLPGDHTAPPADARMALLCQQRMFYVTLTDNKLWFSKIAEYEYVPPLNFIEAQGAITGIAQLGETVAISTATGWQIYSPIDEIGQLRDVQNVVGTSYGDSLSHTDFGLLFCRDDGLYVFDGLRTNRVSEAIDQTWGAGNWRGTYIPGFGYFCNDDMSIEVHRIGSDLLFSTATRDAFWGITPSPDSTKIYVVKGSGVGTLFTPQILHGSSILDGATFKTRKLGSGRPASPVRIFVDLSGSATLTLYSSRGGVSTHSIITDSRRRTVRDMVPTNMAGEWFDIRVQTSNGVIYAVGLETVE